MYLLVGLNATSINGYLKMCLIVENIFDLSHDATNQDAFFNWVFFMTTVNTR